MSPEEKSLNCQNTLSKTFRSLMLLSALLLSAIASNAQVVISQVYGGGGNSGATLKNDYVEIFNAGTSTVDLSIYSVQYSSATGTSWAKTNLTGSIATGQYYLVQEAVGAGGTTNLPAPDATGTIALSATAGKVALVNNQTAMSIACPGSAQGVVDLVGFGPTANCFEGAAPTAAPANATAVLRASGGCTDSNNNSTDFTVGTPNPRNTASTTNPCSGSSPITISNANSLGAGTINAFYSVTFLPSGGSGSGYTFSRSSGTIPNGLTLTGAVLSGTPVVAGTSTFTLLLVDGASNSTTKTFTLVINSPGSCTTTHTISAIQGSGSTSPVVSQAVTTSGIVTALRTNGFFMQMGTGDGDPNTSDGIFVFTSSAPSSAVGSLVCVSGTVTEFRPSTDPFSPTMTEIGSSPVVTLLSTGNPLPAPVILTTGDTNPAGGLDVLERFEGMRVQISSMTVVGPTQGTITESSATSTSSGLFLGVITGIARPFREPGVQLPDVLPAGSPGAVQRWDGNPEIIAVNSTALGGAAINVAAGAILTNVIGPLDYSRRAYTIDVEASPGPGITNNSQTFTAVPTPLTTELTVASFNMERFFDTVDDPSVSDVALTPTAFANRLNKASLAIRNVLKTPDILGVEEMENLTTLQAVATKVNADAMTAGDPNPNYTAFLVEGNDIGGIDVGFLVKTPKVTVNSVTQFGLNALYISPAAGTSELLNDRPPLVLSATVSGLPITVIVNHLRSLNGVDDAVDGPRVRAKREAQAEYLAQLIQGFQNASPSINLVSVGDYNSFQFSDGYVDMIGVIKGTPVAVNQVVTPPTTITNPQLTDMVDTLPAAQQYSYTFSGSAQVLDHILVNPNALSRVTRFAYARNDADFPETYRNDSNRPERISDHDMPVVYINLIQTTVASSAVTIPFNVATQSASLSATVTSSDSTLLNFGTVTFTVAPMGSVTANVVNGVASATLQVPAGQAAGTYQITAAFSGSVSFPSSLDNTKLLTIQSAPVKIVPVIIWAAPASIYLGSALSAVQLNATANVAGTFAYTPGFGTVLSLGFGQALAATFTPTDTVTYATVTASVSINILQLPTPAELVVTRTLAREAGTNDVLVTVRLTNAGGPGAATLTNVRVTKGTIGTASPSVPVLPVLVGSIVGGGQASATLRFAAASVGASGAAGVLSLGGIYDQGSFSSNGRIGLP